VFGFIGRGGRPLSCAVTPYLDGGQPVVTSTLALVGKIGAVLRDERVALLAGGAQARGRATVAIEDDGEWFDRVIRAQELRKYPPARFLLRLPGHRRLLWWYVGRAVVHLPADGLRAVPGSDRVTVTGIDHDGLVSVVPVTGDVPLDADEIPLPAGHAAIREPSAAQLYIHPPRGRKGRAIDAATENFVEATRAGGTP